MESSSKTYKTVKGVVSSEFEEEKSRFITHIKYVETEEEAIEFIDEMNEMYKDATHNCTAYRINTIPEIKRYNDDGEPQGSAGLPMLSVVEKEDVTNVVAVVTRYFGGKLLGKGGLVRAYSKGVSDTLASNTIYKRPFFVVELVHSYNVIGQLENYINEAGLKVIDKSYTDIVKVSLYIREEDFDKISTDLMDLTSGDIKIEKKEEVMLFSK